MKRIVVLTSGGDAPGMNAAIRAVVRLGIYHGLKVFGSHKGYRGLVDDDIVPMDLRSVGDIIHRGGTKLQTARCEEFKTDDGFNRALTTLKKYEIDGVVVIGGDGSFRGAKKLSEAGINAIGIPGTIDNDLQYTDKTIGFDTALNTVALAITNLRDTSSSHGRANIIEVMGRNCGDLALYAGLAGGADAIVVPERDADIETICKKLEEGEKRGKVHHILIVAEGAMSAYKLSHLISERIRIQTRVTILGHLQRGGSPTVYDRNLASSMANHAIKILLEGKTSRVIGVKGSDVFDMDIHDALEMRKEIDESIFELADILSI